jgi:Membrane domain of glycerophosphoryl diester phosphodiesterase
MDDSGGFGAPPPPPPPPSAGGGGAIPQRGVGDLLSVAFEVYKANAAKLITIVAVVVVPLSFVSHFLTGVVLKPHVTTSNITIAGQTVVTSTVSTRSFGTFVLAGLVAAAIAVIISATLQAALTRGAALATVGDPIDVEASYRYGFSRFGSVFWISLLVGLVVAIGFLLFIIPGVIFLTMLAVAIPALIVENRRGTDAMSRSWNLVKGHFWHVLGTIVVAFLITAIVGAIIGLLGDSNWFLQWIFGSIAQIITAPFTALVSILLYIDLRARTEGLTADRLRADLSAAAA